MLLSRRAVVEKEYSAERDELLKTLADGIVVKGIVKNLTDYGAFIDLGGIDVYCILQIWHGVVYVTHLSVWKLVKKSKLRYLSSTKKKPRVH